MNKQEVLTYLENVAEYALKPMILDAGSDRQSDVATGNYYYMQEVIDWIEEVADFEESLLNYFAKITKK